MTLFSSRPKTGFMSLVELLNGLGKCSLYLWFTAFCIYVFITGSFIHYFCIRN